MNTITTRLAVLLLFLCPTLSAQTLDTCGFRTVCHPFDTAFPYYLKWDMSARENGDQYEFYFHGTTTLAPKNRFRRFTTDRQGVILGRTDFMFNCLAAVAGRDGTFLCADTTGTGIRVSRLAAPGDTIWTGVFGQPGLIPYGLLDLGDAGVVVAGAEPYKPPYVWFPKAFLLKIDGDQTETWMTLYDDLGQDGRFRRIFPARDGGYLVEALSYASFYDFTWEEGVRFDAAGNFRWKTKLGDFSVSDVIGLAEKADGGWLSTVYGLGTHGPTYICEFFRLDSAGTVQDNACLTEYMPDNQTYFVNGQSEILPAASGGFLTGMYRGTSTNAAPRFVFVRFDDALDTMWTKGFDRFVRFSAPLPGDAFLGYYLPYFGSDSIGLVKIGAYGEMTPCTSKPTSGVSSLHENTLRIVPNPAGDNAILSFDRHSLPADGADIRILNALGSTVRHFTCSAINNSECALDLTGLSDGWYLLQVQSTGKSMVCEPFVIKR